MSSKKGVSSTRNGRDSNPQYLGVKRFGGQQVGIGEIIVDRLTKLQTKYPEVGDIRGRGAMIAAEFVDPETKAPNAALTAAVAKACIAQGVIVLTCGTYGNVIRLLPPLFDAAKPSRSMQIGGRLISGEDDDESLIEGAEIQFEFKR
mgnify:CR=1 FL=1